MYIKEVEYTDFSGTKRKERFYFHLSESEVLKLEYSTDKSLGQVIKDMLDSNDQPAIMRKFDEIIALAYGIRSADGREFMKSEELTNKFMHSAAYNEIFIEMATDARQVAAFVNAVIPDMKNVIDRAEKNQEINQKYLADLEKAQTAAPGKAPVVVDMPK